MHILWKLVNGSLAATSSSPSMMSAIDIIYFIMQFLFRILICFQQQLHMSENPIHHNVASMIGKSRQLVTDEPVEFEK